MDEVKKTRADREKNNANMGIKVDVDFQVLVEREQLRLPMLRPHISADQLKISVCIKKRPIFAKELENGEIDCVSFVNPLVIVHENRFKVDGITKFIENQEFEFDNTFSDTESNEELYKCSIQPILDLVFNTGTITIFAYGQTGSGKTYTM